MFPYTNSSSSSTTLEGAFFHHFPYPFLDDLDDGLLASHLYLSQQNHNLGMNSTPFYTNSLSDERNAATSGTLAAANMIMSNGDGDDVPFKGLVYKKRRHEQEKQVPWKKIGKKDRHSKICTAQGLRDRRMRLSVKVARKFFDLQDMLDFDKASKTIEWLLINSEAAIRELARTSQACSKHFSAAAAEKCMSSSASVSEVVSETNKEIEVMEITGEDQSLVGTKPREMRKKRRTCYIARESRDKARARARDRTREKMKIRGFHQRSHSQNTESNQLKTSKNHLEAGKDTACCGANEFPGFTAYIEARTEPEAAGRYAMTSKKPSLGNGQVQNKAIFSITPNAQEHNSTSWSTFMTISNGGQWNPSSIFGTTPSAQDQQQNPIPNSILMNTNAPELGIPSPLFTATNSSIGFHSHFTGSHFL